MNSQPEQDSERRLEQLEAELNSPPSSPAVISEIKTPEQSQKDISPNLQPQLKRFFNWFNNLSNLGKLTVIVVGAIVGIAILRAVLSLVAAVISLGVLAVLLYLAYQFFIVRKTENKD